MGLVHLGPGRKQEASISEERGLRPALLGFGQARFSKAANGVRPNDSERHSGAKGTRDSMGSLGKGGRCESRTGRTHSSLGFLSYEPGNTVIICLESDFRGPHTAWTLFQLTDHLYTKNTNILTPRPPISWQVAVLVYMTPDPGADPRPLTPEVMLNLTWRSRPPPGVTGE